MQDMFFLYVMMDGESQRLMKACLLDIDGCLNFADYGVDIYYDKYYGKKVALDDECIERLKRLLERFPDLKIIWSTDWRFLENDYWYEWKHPLKHLEEIYPWLRERVAGKTPKKMSSERWHEVKWWLDDNSAKIDGYVIIDDIVFPESWFGIEKHIVQCDPCKGFTEENLIQAVKILEYGGKYDIKSAKRMEIGLEAGK